MAAEVSIGTVRRALTALCLLVLIVGCSTTERTPATVQAPSPTHRSAEASTTSTTAGVAPRPTDIDIHQAEAGDTGPGVPPLPSRTADSSGPFGQPDVWQGAQAAPSGLQRPLEPGDRPGPLLKWPPESERSQAVPLRATLGFSSSDAAQPELLGGIWFAPWESPLDEVGVLAETVKVRDGVLRGLVRNWSRRLWAYEVTVSAGDHVFEWPLSVQPGEIAPFEFPGWEGPADSDLIRISVDADMSWHTDPSRAFDRSSDLHLWAGDYAQRALAEAVRDRYPQVTSDVAADAVSVGVLEWYGARPHAPDSHPSLRDDIENLTVADLRGYGALFDRDGRIVDVAAAPAVRLWLADDDGENNYWQRRRWEDVPSLPHGDFGLFRVSLRLDVHAPWPDLEWDNWRLPPSDYAVRLQFMPEDGDWWREYIEGGYLFWIGAAYPRLDSGVR